MAPILLPNLPNEVLCKIIRLFCLHCRGEHSGPSTIGTLPQHEQDLQDQRGEQNEGTSSWYSEHYILPLWSLSLTSKRLRCISQPVLHHEFVLGHGDSWKSEGIVWKKRLILFMRTMRERRDLAKVVKVASIHSHLITWIDNQDAIRTFFANSDAMYIDLPGLWIKRAKKHLTDPHDHFSRFLMTLFDHGRGLDSKAKESVEDKYEPHYGHGDCWLMSQLVAMLIKQLPNLQHFSTRGCQHILGSSPESFLADLQLLHLPMKILDIETWISPLVELASGLETLNIHGTWALEPPIPKMPNLKVLRLIPKELKAHWDPSASFLEDILLACTGSLCTFVLEAPSAGNGKYSVPGMELGRIIYLLRHHQNTLKCLHLDIRRVRFPKVRQYQYPSLNDFTSLEHLLLSSNAMAISSDGTSEYEFLNRMIPPSIKTLHFLVSQFGGKRDLEKDLRRLASSKWHTPTVLPNLRQVICDLEHPFMNNDVANDFTAVGVEFGYKRWREFEHGRDRPNDGRYNFRVVGDVPIRLELGRTSYY